MTKLFLSVVQLDLSAAGWVLLLLLLRRVFADLPKAFYHGIWLVMFAVLIIPARIIFKIPVAKQTAVLIKGGASDSVSSHGISTLEIAGTVWLAGFLGLVIYSLICTVLLQLRLRGASEIYPHVYKSSYNSDAFVLGIFAPKIYLPDGINALQEQYILCHEKTHIRRLDHITKLFAFFVTALHWFNPIIWLMFFTLSHDMEMACDEAVLRKIGIGSRKSYVLCLLDTVQSHGLLNVTFGAPPIKRRIVNMMKLQDKKHLSIAAVLLFAAVTLCSCGKIEQIKPTPIAETAKSDNTISVTKETSPDYYECSICKKISVLTTQVSSYTCSGEIKDCIHRIHGQDQVIEHHTMYQSFCTTSNCSYQSTQSDTVTYTSLECHGWN